MEDSQRLHFKDHQVNVDEQSWETEKRIVDGALKDGVVMLIFDFMDYPDNKVAQNLEGFSLNGEHLWTAENPVDTPNEAYVEFLPEDESVSALQGLIQVGDQAGFQCDIDIKTGKLLSVVYKE